MSVNGLGNDTQLMRVPTIGYTGFVQLYWTSASKYWRRYRKFYADDYHLPGSFLTDLRTYCALHLSDVAVVLATAALWTLLRHALTKRFFMPWARQLRLDPPSQTEKFPESAWKLSCYGILWVISLVITLGSPSRSKYFWDPLSVWDDHSRTFEPSEWQPTMAIEWPVGVAYTLQASFYVHCLYATFYMDVWRKDSVAMVVHHCLAVSLLAFSYGCRHHQVGMMVLLLHDISDILLEVTKLNTYLKRRQRSHHAVHEWIANIFFVAFASSWFYCRLYLYPLKVMYTASYGSVNMADHRYPFNPLFNAMLLMLLTMNVWWFHFIILLLYRVATGTLKEVDDTREFNSDNEPLIIPNGKPIEVQANGQMKKED